MIHSGIDFHGIEELLPLPEGLLLRRIPGAVRVLQDPGCAQSGEHCSGVELRFRIRSGERADLYLHARDITEGLPALILYGSFQGGWEYSAKSIGTESTRLTVRATPRLRQLKELTEKYALPFSPEVVRVLLPYTSIVFERVEGDVVPPGAGDVPSGTLLTYGSSITHGSLALGSPASYGSRLANALGMDWINVGLAGCCRLEEGVVRWLFSRRDWQVMTCEMGINMLMAYTAEAFRARVRAFADLAEKDPRPVFVTDIFAVACDEAPDKTRAFRSIVREECAGRLHYTPALSLLGEEQWISEDLVHPSAQGHALIAENWAPILKSSLKALPV